ncbi:hypothetical protein BPTFM16_01460 [Altererythrobacter insulae]|nr:hypothetical protein BPTFM16_01460 [Altererythrobacter insulae]
MRSPKLFVYAALVPSLFFGLPASAEPYEQYLERLRVACAVDCLQPRQFLREARKRSKDDLNEMAVIIDVVAVQRVGSKYELHNIVIDRSPLEVVALLASAGIDASQRTGVGGMPRGERFPRHPNVIVIEMDERTLQDVLSAAPQSNLDRPAETADAQGEILVEGDLDQAARKPSLSDLDSFFRNRRIVARGTPRLETVFNGGRRDFRRKQVTLELTDADNIIRLPKYDDEGRVILAE